MAASPPYDVAFYAPHGGGRLGSPSHPTAGGAETQLVMLAGALAQRGLRVALIVAGEEGTLIGRDGIDVIPQPTIRDGDRARDTVARTRETLAAMRSARARTLVQRGASGGAGLARLAAWTTGARFVFSSANVSDFSFGEVEPSRRTRALYGLGVRRADEVVVQTSEQVAMCEAAFGRRPRLIRSLAEPHPARTAAPEAFLWVGRTAAFKRPELYVELAARIPEARFWMILVPSGPDRGAVEARVAPLLARAPNVEVLEPRSREAVGELIARSVAVVNTSTSEGFSNVVLEAWARGVPSLVLSHDPDGLIAEQGLGGFADGSMDRLTELGRALWDGRDDQGELARRCRGWIAEHHASVVVVDAWCDVLELPRRADRAAAMETVG